MKKALFFIIILSLIVAIMASCDLLPPAPIDDSEPSSFPLNSRLDIEIITIDDITPAGPITLRVTNDGDDRIIDVEMEAGNSNVTGTTEWSAWVDLSAYGSNTVTLDFLNSAGDSALGLIKEVEPWYREVNMDTRTPYEVVDEVNSIFLYRETIRHWESGSNGRSIDFSGTAVDDQGNPLVDYKFQITAYHHVNQNSSYGYTVYNSPDNLSATGFTETLESIHTIEREADLPNSDWLSFYVKKNFYNEGQEEIEYESLHGQNSVDLGQFNLYANRIIGFSFLSSADGNFSAGSGFSSGNEINTVSRYDFTDYNLADYYYDSIGDPYLADRLNEYYFDSQQEIGFRMNSYYDDFTASFRTMAYTVGNAGRIMDLTEAGISDPLTEDFDLSSQLIEAAYGWNWGVTLEAVPGQVFGVRTDYGYALIRIESITEMTQTQMENIEAEWQATLP